MQYIIALFKRIIDFPSFVPKIVTIKCYIKFVNKLV